MFSGNMSDPIISHSDLNHLKEEKLGSFATPFVCPGDAYHLPATMSADKLTQQLHLDFKQQR